MKLLCLILANFSSVFCSAQFSYVVDLQGNVFSLNISAGCQTLQKGNCSFSPITDIAVTSGGLLYLCNYDSLFSMDISGSGECIFLGRFDINDVTGLVVGADGNVYASGSGLGRYDPVSQNFTFLGHFPPGVRSSGDLVVFNDRMYMSATDGNIYQINIANPAGSVLYLNLGLQSIYGMAVVLTSCFNNPVPRAMILAFSPRDLGAEGYLIDMESKMVFPQYCLPDVAIAGSADYSVVAVEGESIVIDGIRVTNPLCTQVADGSILIQMKQSDKNVYSFSLNGLPDVSDASFNGLSAGQYSIRIKNQFGCYIDTVANIDYPVLVCKDTLFVPSAFTPNGDGLNDIFRPLGNMLPLSDYEMTVYNRYGQQVFRTSNLQNGWNGIFKSAQQPAGIYIWQMRYRNFRGIQVYKKGLVTLIR